jgi:Tfp pilus assembly protein PilV
MEVQQVIRSRRQRGAAGFSFIEVVIASLLLLMIAVAVLPMFTEAAASNETGREYTDVSNFARSRAEEFVQLPFNAEPVTITAGTSRVHNEYYSATSKKWLAGTAAVSPDRALWLRTTTIRQFEAKDTTLSTPLAAGTDPLRIHVKEVQVEVRGASIGSLFGPAKSITVRALKTS